MWLFFLKWSFLTLWFGRKRWSQVQHLGISLRSSSRAHKDQELHSCWQISYFWSRPILFTSSGPDQKHYGSATVDLTHVLVMRLCLMAWDAVCICGVCCLITQENGNSAIRSNKACLHALCHFLASNWVCFLGFFLFLSKAHHLLHKSYLFCCRNVLSVAQTKQENKAISIQTHNKMIIKNRALHNPPNNTGSQPVICA